MDVWFGKEIPTEIGHPLGRRPTTHSSRRHLAASKIGPILKPDFISIAFLI
jgi:hypothetical protein